MVANLLVDLYERGAVRDALDEGVRAGVPVATGPEACIARANEVVHSIASGSSLHVDDINCSFDGERVVATARVTLRSWFPMLLPDWRLTLQAAALRER